MHKSSTVHRLLSTASHLSSVICHLPSAISFLLFISFSLTLTLSLTLTKSASAQLDPCPGQCFDISQGCIPCPTPTPTPASATSTGSGNDLLNKINQKGVETSQFDDKYFNLNQLYGILDNTDFFLTGNSSSHPEITQVAMENGQGGGAVAGTGKLLALFATQPVSGVEYFASVAEDAGFISEADAQGFGFSRGLQPVQSIWSFFRNLAYAGFVIVFVIFGFMIMLRTKIDPQAVASIQSALPRIIIALIMVTFSYAFAGLMVDLMYVLTSLAVNILGAGMPNPPGPVVVHDVEKQPVLTSLFSLWGSHSSNIAKFLIDAANSALKLPEIVDQAFGWALDKILRLVFAIVYLFIAFRIFLMLIMAYVQIIILTIFAPIQFLFSAMPGQSPIGWFKSMLANILVFPTVVLMLAFATFIGSKFGVQGGTFFEAPLLSGFGVNALAGLISFGVILMIPKAAESIKQAVGQKGPGLGVDWGPVAGAAAAAAFPINYYLSKKRKEEEARTRNP